MGSRPWQTSPGYCFARRLSKFALYSMCHDSRQRLITENHNESNFGRRCHSQCEHCESSESWVGWHEVQSGQRLSSPAVSEWGAIAIVPPPSVKRWRWPAVPESNFTLERVGNLPSTFQDTSVCQSPYGPFWPNLYASVLCYMECRCNVGLYLMLKKSNWL